MRQNRRKANQNLEKLGKNVYGIFYSLVNIQN